MKMILFDLGGVVLNLDYHATARAFEELGVNDFNAVYSQAKQTSLFDELEVGKVSEQGFREELRKILRLNLSDGEIDQAWNAMLLDLPEQRMLFLEQLATRFPIYLLSNTNAIHVNAFEDIVDQAVGLRRFKEAFQATFYSNEIGFRKPNADAFEYVLSEMETTPEEVLFIDDSIQHIQGAEALGIYARQLKKGMDLKESVNAWIKHWDKHT